MSNSVEHNGVLLPLQGNHSYPVPVGLLPCARLGGFDDGYRQCGINGHEFESGVLSMRGG